MCKKNHSDLVSPPLENSIRLSEFTDGKSKTHKLTSLSLFIHGRSAFPSHRNLPSACKLGTLSVEPFLVYSGKPQRKSKT